MLWYIAACADELGATLDDVAEFNVEKLAERHGTNPKGEVINTFGQFTEDFSQKDDTTPPHIRLKEALVV